MKNEENDGKKKQVKLIVKGYVKLKEKKQEQKERIKKKGNEEKGEKK